MYKKRVEKFGKKLRVEGIAAVVIEDSERRRSTNLPYLSGMPSEALLFIFSGKGEGEARSLLLPWDMILAGKIAWADEVKAYGEYGRMLGPAVEKVLEEEGIAEDAVVELPAATPHYMYEEIGRSSGRNFLCRNNGAETWLSEFRQIKDEEEIAILKEGARLTNRLLEELELSIRKGELKTEIDVALFIERRARTLGCEGTGFETICAGPSRSWGIHAHPLFTAGEFGTKGLSLVDFGVKYRGYVTDVTASFVKGPLSEKQEEMVALVEETYKAAAAMVSPGVSTMAVADRVTEIFDAAGWVMPHSLGHSFGLEAHENPVLRTGRDPVILEPGMIVTIEPGLYDEEEGGVRWENDFLITEDGAECLTKSRIFRMA